MPGAELDRLDADVFVERVRKSAFPHIASNPEPSIPPSVVPATAHEDAAPRKTSLLGEARRVLRAGVNVIPDAQRKRLKRSVRRVVEGYAGPQLSGEIERLRRDTHTQMVRSLDFLSEQLKRHAALGLRRMETQHTRLADEVAMLRIEVASLKQLLEVPSVESFYLDAIRAAGAGTEGKPIIDLCSGECLRLDVLKRRAPSSAGAVLAIEGTEHLGLEEQVALLDQAYRVLSPGGVLVMVTSAPDALRLLLAQRGFDRVLPTTNVRMQRYAIVAHRE